jgi:hypothetical protein
MIFKLARNQTFYHRDRYTGSGCYGMPGSCASISGGGGVVYNCNSVYYQPYYQGTTLVYQVVTYP